MPLSKLQFKPGINRENTNYAGEGGWFDCDKVRFRSGYPEKIGGWQNLASSVDGVFNTYKGVCRNLWNWITLNSSNLLALGTEQKLYVENGGFFYDITPIRNTETLGTDPFEFTSGSKLVVVNDTGHGATVGTYVSFTTDAYLRTQNSDASVTTPNSTALSITGDFEIQVRLAADDWTSGQEVLFKTDCFRLAIDSSGNLVLEWADDFGTSLATSTVATGFSDGSSHWIKATLDVNDGSGNHVVTFYTAPDAATPVYTILGSAVVTAGVTNVQTANTPLSISYTVAGFNGYIRRVKIYSGIGGTLVADFNPYDAISGDTIITSSATGETWTTSGTSSEYIFNMTADFEIVEIVDANSYNVVLSDAFAETINLGGTGADANYQINSGNSVASVSTGWGIGPWSRDGWGEEFSGTAVVQETNALRLWSMDNYGQDLVAAIREGPIYYWVADTTTSPPRADTLESLANTAGYDGDFVPNRTYEIHTSGVQRFAICVGANPYDPGDSETDFDPMLVRWSDQENIYQWVPSATNQSGEIRLSHGSRLVTGRHSRQEFVLWSDSAIYSMQYLGPPYVWGVNLLMDGISIASPNAVVGSSNVMYWMGLDKFYMYDGRVQTLPCSVRQFVFDNINPNQFFQVVAGGNEQYSEVWWFYPSLNSTVNDRYVVFNYLEGTWYYGSLNRTAWLDSAVRKKPMGAFSVRTSYLSTTIGPSDTTINLLDASSYPAAGVVQIENEQISYASRTAVSLNNCVRGINSTTAVTHLGYSTAGLVVPNQIMYHEVGNDDLSTSTITPIEAYIDSSDFDIGDGHNFGFIWRILPDLTFDGSTTVAPNYPSVTMVCRPRQNSGSAYGTPSSPAVTSAQSYNTERVYTVQQFTGQVMTRVRGRQMAFEIRSTGQGVAWQLGTPRIDIRPDGRKS